MSPLLVANNGRNENCPLCHSQRIEKTGSILYACPIRFSTTEIELERTPELWKCRECKSSFVQNTVPENMAVSLYSQGESAERWSRELFVRQKPANQIDCLARYLLAGKHVLDVGCNAGELLDYARSLECITAGVEYSGSSRRILEEKGHAVFPSLGEVDKRFDVITAFDLIEHLYNVPAFLDKCRRVLVPNGVLVILTGNIQSLSAQLCKSQWWYLRYPEHIVFPSDNFFVRHSGLKMCEWIRTYASAGYKAPLLSSIRRIPLDLSRGIYNGLPSIGPDHLLAVLKLVS